MDPQLSPGAWLEFLEPRLDEQAKIVDVYRQYYDGEQKLQMATQKFKEAFARFFGPMANNWMQVVVDAPVSRLEVQGFRFTSMADSAKFSGKPTWQLEADQDAWKMWQANNLDSRSRMLHTDIVKLGLSYLLVAPPRKEGGEPVITAEHPNQCYVHVDPEDSTHRLAGFKRWVSEFDGLYYCNLYLPTATYKFKSTSPAREGRKIQWTSIGSVTNPAGVVPLIPLENKPDLLYGGRSDLEQAIPIQDAINKYCLDMIVSSEFHAFPQRWASGWEKAVDDTGREISGRQQELYLAASRIIRAENNETKFGQFTQGDVDNYLKPIHMYVEHLAAQTQTPLYYLKGTMRTMSADAMHAEDQGLVDRVKAKQGGIGEGHEEALRVGFLMKGGEFRAKGEAESAEVLWADAESKSLAVVTQAAQIMYTQLKVPLEYCWESLGFSPQKIKTAMEIQGLPPGGGEPPAMQQAAMPGKPGANDANTHPGNQRGQPSGQSANGGSR